MRARLSLDGVEISDAALIDGLAIEQDSTEAISTAEFAIIQAYGVGRYDTAQYSQASYVYEWELKEWAEIIIWDEDTNNLLFGGYIMQIDRSAQQQHLRYGVRCVDWGIIAEKTIVTMSWPAGTVDATIVTDLVAALPDQLSAGTITPQVAMGEFEVKDQSVRDALAQLCELTGGEWNVSYDGKVNYYRQGSIAAPFALSDNPSPPDSIGYMLDTFESDFSDAANRVIVLGAVTDSGEVRAVANHGNSQAQYGLLSTTLIDRNLTDQASADLWAQTEVATRALPKPTITASILTPGLARGMTVDIEAVRYGVSASLILRKLKIVIAAPDRKRAPVAGHMIKYSATLGWRAPDIVYSLRRMQRKPVERTQAPAALVPPGSIDAGDFAAGIEPVRVVASLPALPNPDYSPTAVVLWINAPRGPQLYRRTGNTWTAYVDAAAIEGQLQTTQLAPGSVTSAVLADGSVVTAKIPSGAIKASQLGPGAVTVPALGPGAVTGPAIASSAITAGNIAANAIQSLHLLAGAVTAGKIAANAIGANEISAGAITATALAAGSVTANAIAANAIAAEKIQSNAIQTQHLTANSVVAGKIAALAVVAGNLAADSVTAGTIAAGAVRAGSIAADAITSVTIAAGAVVVGKLGPGAVTPGTLAAEAVTAGAIKAGTIDSSKLSTVEIAVGYGFDKPGRVGIYDTNRQMVALLGDLSGAGASAYGGWFRVFGAGGSNFYDARIKSDTAGNLGIYNANFSVTSGSYTVSITPTTIDPDYGSLSVKVSDPAATASVVSRGLIIYSGSTKVGAFNRAPGGGWGEITLYGGSYIILSGNTGQIRADGGYAVSGSTGVTRTVAVNGVTLEFRGGICTNITP
jgi:hypothetical protein